jgi:hypothetical protein
LRPAQDDACGRAGRRRSSWNVLMALALSCAACGRSPTVLTVYRTEEQAQTHCPKDAVVWLDAQSGLYYLKGQGSYGRSTAGRYACRGEADSAGMHGVPN